MKWGLFTQILTRYLEDWGCDISFRYVLTHWNLSKLQSNSEDHQFRKQFDHATKHVINMIKLAFPTKSKYQYVPSRSSRKNVYIVTSDPPNDLSRPGWWLTYLRSQCPSPRHENHLLQNRRGVPRCESQSASTWWSLKRHLSHGWDDELGYQGTKYHVRIGKWTILKLTVCPWK